MFAEIKLILVLLLWSEYLLSAYYKNKKLQKVSTFFLFVTTYKAWLKYTAFDFLLLYSIVSSITINVIVPTSFVFPEFQFL